MSQHSPKIKLFVYATSPYAGKVAAVLHYKRLPFEVVHVDPLRKQALAFAPRRVVPTLMIDQAWRQESTDLCVWLDARFPQSPILGETPAQRQNILAIDRWVSEQVMPGFFRELIHWDGDYRLWLQDRWRYMRVLHRSSPLPLAVRLLYPWAVQQTGFIRKHARQANWEESLPMMRRRLVDEFVAHLGTGPFLGGQSALSLADLALYPMLAIHWMIGQARPDPWMGHAAVRAWMQRVTQQLPAHPFLIDPDCIVKPLAALDL